MDEEAPIPASSNISCEPPAGTIASNELMFPPTLWQTYRYAPEWFADAVEESGREGHQARRREILFAVCAAESYLGGHPKPANSGHLKTGHFR